ncbi:hypothetical protein BDQ17DRAFT_1432743 [Cyathus striatus]|nr:hypothetical protein BDQ17DRAFT_1432743 [Cyathus striatus]
MPKSRSHPSVNLTSNTPPRNSLIPTHSHRHAAPSAPWPWVDIDDGVDPMQLQTELQPVPVYCDHGTCGGFCWKEYPRSQFPNWTDKQVKKSKIWDAMYYYNIKNCVIYHVDVNDKGLFTNADSLTTFNDDMEGTWRMFMEPRSPEGLRARALFIENLSGPVLQMLGAKYNIEPFFFSSSLNWIPSRYQEGIRPGEGDHITITMTFLRSLSERSTTQTSSLSEHTGPQNLTLPYILTLLK